LPKKIRFIHTADLHLGSPLKAVGELSEELQNFLKEASYTAFERIVDAAIAYNVNFMLISGDIYDREARSVAANRFFVNQMERLREKNIPVFITYGNHDPMDSSTEFFKVPENVKIFSSDTVTSHEIFDSRGILTARILGQSYRNPMESRKMHQDFNPPDDGAVNIGMLHTGLNPGINAYVPCSLEELKNKSSIHYWALGHIHRPAILNSALPAISFPGIPQGRDMGEKGLKGCFLVISEPQASPQIHFIPTSPVIWLTREISIDSHRPLENLNDLEELLVDDSRRIINSVPEAPCGCPAVGRSDFSPQGYIVRWIITGRGKIHDEVISGNEDEIADHLEQALRQHMASVKPFLWTESIRFSTGTPISDFEALLKQDEIIRCLVHLQEKIEKDPELRRQAISAMGSIWFEPNMEEDTKIDAFPVTEERLRHLLEQAKNLALESILRERENS